MTPKVTVLGTGNAGTSLAGVLTLAGIDVSLAELPEFEASLEPIVGNGGIDVKGEYGVGLARPAVMTTDIREAIRGRQILMFCHPAYAHEAFTRACAPHLEAGQLLVYISYFGAIRMRRLLSTLGVQAKVTTGETLSFVYACDKTGPHHALVKRRKEGLPFSVFPARDTGKALDLLNQVFEDFAPARNCLETSVNNVNPWTHPAGVLLNAGWIEATEGGFSFYMEGMTPSVLRLQRAMDDEKMEVAAALGLERITNSELARRMYRKIVEKVGGTHQKQYYAGVKDAPKTVKHRYLLEDMRYGVVPIASLARQLRIPTPALDATITIASIVAEADLWNDGITMKSLGADGLTASELVDWVERGDGLPA